MTDDYRLTVAICAVDETFSLARTFRKLDSYGAAYEYLFVLSRKASDGCRRTVNELSRDPRCRQMEQPGTGFGDALKTVFREARGTHVLVWSADEATDTASFPEMLRLSRANPDAVVKISRFLDPDGFRGYGAVKKRLNAISQAGFRLLYRSALTEFTNPTQIAPAALYRRIRWERDGFELTTEMTFKPLRLGVRFIEVPTKNVPREEGRSHRTPGAAALYYYMILKIRFSPVERLIAQTEMDL